MLIGFGQELCVHDPSNGFLGSVALQNGIIMVFDMGGVDFNLTGAQQELLIGLVNCSTRTGELKQETFFLWGADSRSPATLLS